MLDYQESITEFQAGRDPRGAREAMGEEVEKLLLTLPPDQRPAMEDEMKGFRCFFTSLSFITSLSSLPPRRLFDKFVSEPGPSVEWSQIQDLPKDSILDFHRYFLSLAVEQEQEFPVGNQETKAETSPGSSRSFQSPSPSLPTSPSAASAKAMLDQLVVVKLNGALGTALGCRCHPL